MAATPLSTSLGTLVEYLDSLTARADMQRLGRLLRDLDITFEDVRDFACFDERCYKRNLICEGPWYQALALCWSSGQRSPIHNHAQSVCGVKVLKGSMTETVFEMTPTGYVKAVCSREQACGAVCVNHDADIHQVSNLQSPGEDLVTLHIYSPPLVSMEVYSLTDNKVTTFAGTPAGASRTK